MRLVDVNEAVCRLSGYTRQELFALDHVQLGIADATLVAHGFDAPAGAPALRQSATLHRKDGSSLAVSIDWRALQGGSVVVGVISTPD
jgi:PAS domain-containing protein